MPEKPTHITMKSHTIYIIDCRSPAHVFFGALETEHSNYNIPLSSQWACNICIAMICIFDIQKKIKLTVYRIWLD